MTPVRWKWIAATLLFLLPLGLLSAPGVPHGKYELVVDMRAGDSPTKPSGTVQVWINSTAGESFCQQTVPGRRCVYRFSLEKYKTVEYIRIDPTDIAGLPVHLYQVRIEKPGRVIQQFTPQGLTLWRTNAEYATVEDDALVLRAEHRDPQIDLRFPKVWLSGTHHSFLGRLAVHLFWKDHSRETFLVLLTVSTLLVVVLGLLRGGRLTAVVLAIALPITYLLLRLALRIGGRPPDGASVLGYALYTGYPKSAEAFLCPLLFAVPVVTALVAVYLRRKLLAAPPALSEPAPALPSRPRGWGSVIVLGLLLVVLACYFCPDLAAARPSKDASITLQWDGNNFLTWRYLLQTGAKPYKDFWYPYSGQMLFDLAYPYGALSLALHRFALFAFLLIAIYLSTGRRLTATLIIFASLFGLYLNGFFEWPERYGLIVNVLLAYAAIDRGVSRVQAGHVLFWLTLVHVVIIEPTSVLYVGVPIFLSMLVDLVRLRSAFFAGLFGHLVRAFVPPSVALAGVAIYLGIQGQLPGFIAFMGSLGAQAAYGAFPLDILSWLKMDAPVEAFLLASTVILLALGLLRECTTAERPGREGRVLLLLGAASIMLLMKLFIRPHMGNQLLFINVSGILFYLFATSPSNVWQRGGVVFSAGLLFAHLTLSPFPLQVFTYVRGSVARACASVPCLALDAAERHALTALQFSPRQFQLSAEHLQVMQRWTELSRNGEAKPLFVLSDDPIFYVLTGSLPYFHTNGYNASPLQEQKHVLALLKAAPPKVIIWRWLEFGMDGVPPVLRNPLLYEYVILHYVPLAPVSRGPVVLLRPRQPDEAVAIDFWRERLGHALHLGHIPRFANKAKFPQARDGDEESAEFLTVTLTNPAAITAQAVPDSPLLPQIGGYHPQGRTFLIPILCAGRSFSLGLSLVPGQTEYHILLNRIWFWGVLKKAGLKPTLGVPLPGVELRLERRAMNENVLY